MISHIRISNEFFFPFRIIKYFIFLLTYVHLLLNLHLCVLHKHTYTAHFAHLRVDSVWRRRSINTCVVKGKAQKQRGRWKENESDWRRGSWLGCLSLKTKCFWMIYLFPASMHSLIKEQQTARFADRPCCMQTSWVAVMHYQTHIKIYVGTQRQQNPETEVGQANQLGLATFKKCNGVPLFRIRYDGCKGTCTLIYTV